MAFVIQDVKDDRYAFTAKTSVFTPEFSRRFNSVKQEKDQLFRADEIKRMCRFAVSRMCKKENGVTL